MATKKKLLQAAAGSAGGAGADVSEVFSTTLYKTNNTNLTVTTGLDGTGSEKVLYWTKPRVDAAQDDYSLVDNVRQTSSFTRLASNRNDAETTSEVALYQFTSTGYLAGQAAHFNGNLQGSNSGGGVDQVTWGFKKTPKFFDIVTYTGDGTNNRAISHSLGTEVGMIITKKRNAAGNWGVYHRSVGNSLGLRLNSDGVAGALSINNETVNNTTFGVSTGGYALDNNNGDDYVAYLFAHNDGDGNFGPDGDQDIIKCGNYTGNGQTAGPEINLGFEPQWVFIKNTSTAANWMIVDSLRTAPFDGVTKYLTPNNNGVENANGNITNFVNLTSTGFSPKGNFQFTNTNGDNYVYVAIRRGPLAEPESATDVFAIDQGANVSDNQQVFDAGFPVDLLIRKDPTQTYDFLVLDRLRGNSKFIETNTDIAEATTAYGNQFDSSTGIITQTGFNFSAHYAWMWRRAPSYFDIVHYSGTGSATTITHNLGVAPEMMWIKDKGRIQNWAVYHKDNTAEPATDRLRLNETGTTVDDIAYWNDTQPTSSVFTVGTDGDVNASGEKYIAYLFATVAGVSKVGGYVGNSTDGHQIDCGFSSGARFVLLKNTTVSATNWLLFDSVRGIVAGNDARLYLNTSGSENSGTDYIDPYSSGFELTANAQVNYSGSTYIFYAIA